MEKDPKVFVAGAIMTMAAVLVAYLGAGVVAVFMASAAIYGFWQA